ncbi:MAG: hypothetical protein MJZ50_08220 [Treponema sp.]|nr:hypothetical protein [Treponema sp.]
MSEERELTRIERELVLQYLRDDNVPLTVTLEEKPEKSEAELVSSKTGETLDENRVPVSAVFPVAISSDQMTVLNQGIILLKNPARTVQPFLGRQVRVQFYFNHLGLYFITEMKEYSQGLAIVVPNSIKRIPDSVTKAEYDFTGTVSYSAENTTVSIDCVPLAGYGIFSAAKWSEILESNQHQAKALLEQYVAEVKAGDVQLDGNGLHLLTVVRYLTELNRFAPPSAVEGRAMPFNMVYVDDKRAILAGGVGTENLDYDIPYTLNLVFVLSENRLLKRNVSINCTVEKIYTNPENPEAKCISLRYKELKQEDYRFIYERITGKKYDME